MKKIKDRNDRLEHLIRLNPVCEVCGINFSTHINIVDVKMRYPQFKGWSAADIYAALRVEIHHRMPDSDVNVARYPLFIHSDLNLLPLHARCHHDNKFWAHIGDEEAEILENELAVIAVKNSDNYTNTKRNEKKHSKFTVKAVKGRK